MNLYDDVQRLLDIFPQDITNLISSSDSLVEIVLDLGRPLELRYTKNQMVVFDEYIVTDKILKQVLNKVSKFGEDNRAGIDGTLHRISRILNRYGDCIGLTCRVGKPFYGSVDLIRDFLDEGKSILLLGPPGAGKTTLLRDTARYLSESKRVIIVDTSNEIAGDGNIVHPAVGRARRLQVPSEKTQHLIMIEAVENHTPQSIIIDEMSTQAEAQAARTIAQRGVQLIATAHGRKLEDLINNPPLSDLVGGVNVVTLSDDTTRQRGLPSKTVQERKTEPTFDVVVELLSFTEVCVHPSVKEAVDIILAGGYCRPEERRVLGGVVRVVVPAKLAMPVVPESALVGNRIKIDNVPASNGKSNGKKRLFSS